jgi:uncharacterized protein (TIGR02611 family)
MTPRFHDLVNRVDAWAHRGRGRALLVRIGVTLVGPLLVLAGIAMTVLPGPGLVVVALGLALLALEYEWARRTLGLLGRLLSNARKAALPREGSRRRRVLGVLSAAGFVAATTVLTTAVTTFVGTQALL